VVLGATRAHAVEKKRSTNPGKECGERFKEKLGKSWESDYEAADWFAVGAAERLPGWQIDGSARKKGRGGGRGGR